MRITFMLVTVGILTSSVAAKPSIEQELPGARVYFRTTDRELKYKDISTGRVHTVGSNARGVVRVSGDGRFVVSAEGSSNHIIVYNTASGEKVFETTSINFEGGSNGDAMDINWDGSLLYTVIGQRKLVSIRVPGGQVTEVFTLSSSNAVRESEFGADTAGRRFVGRYDNDKAIYADVVSGHQGSYANDCSPCISPSGTRCAVNKSGHTTMDVYRWSLGSGLGCDSPGFWKTISSQVGTWDNHNWSNHDSYIVSDWGKIINVDSENSWDAELPSDRTDYCDLWVYVETTLVEQRIIGIQATPVSTTPSVRIRGLTPEHRGTGIARNLLGRTLTNSSSAAIAHIPLFE